MLEVMLSGLYEALKRTNCAKGPCRLYAMQPKDSCIENLHCRWCMQRLMCALPPGEWLVMGPTQAVTLFCAGF